MTVTADVEAFLAGVPKPEDPLIQRGRYQMIESSRYKDLLPASRRNLTDERP